MDIEREVRAMAGRSDETTRRKLVEYLALRERLQALTGQPDPIEGSLVDVILIEDPFERRMAGAIAARMRRLIRETVPTLSD